MYNIRQARSEDIPRLFAIFSEAREKMRASGNLLQWNNNYPSKHVVRNDVESGECYAVERDGQLVATFVLALGPDPTYARIESGSWRDGAQTYSTMHRMASRHGEHGVADAVITWCKTQTNNLRADTHRDNQPMQHILTKHGFQYCGIIHVADGTERLAYQWLQ